MNKLSIAFASALVLAQANAHAFDAVANPSPRHSPVWVMKFIRPIRISFWRASATKISDPFTKN